MGYTLVSLFVLAFGRLIYLDVKNAKEFNHMKDLEALRKENSKKKE